MRRISEPGVPTGRKPPGLVTMMLIAVAFFCLLLMDPFGIETASFKRSEQAVLRVTAPFYANSGKVVVVLIDDEYLARVGRSWPLPYAEQGRLLRTVFQAAPAVVFLDILYRQRHGPAEDATAANGSAPGDEPMNLLAPIESFTDTPLIFSAQIRQDLRNSTVPTICPEEPPVDSLALRDDASILPAFQAWQVAHPAQASIALIGWWGCGDRYPLRLPGGSAEATPALAILDAWCGRHGRTQAGCEYLQTGGGKPGATPYAAPLVVRWGAFPPADQRPFYAAGTCQPYAEADGGVSVWRSLRASVTQLLLGVFEDLRDSPRPGLALPCPAVNVLPASVIRYGDPGEVRALLRDKIVLVGARVTGVSDWHQSPVHGQVPGVILHAAAADNLLTLGDHYARDLSSGATTTAAIIVLALLAFLVPILVITLDEPKRRAVSAVGLLCWFALAAFLAYAGASAQSVLAAIVVGIAIDMLMPMETLIYLLVIFLMGGGAALLILQGVAPSNWIGMVIVSLAFAATVKQFYRQEALKEFPHPVSFLGPAVQPWLDRLDRLHFHDWIEGFKRWHASRTAAPLPPAVAPAEQTSGESP